MSALAFRLERHHLNARVTDAATAAVAGLQDTPPGTAAVSLAARADVTPEALGDLVTVYSIRGTPLAVSPADVPLFTAGLEPPDEAAARAVTGNARKTLDMPLLEALDRVTEAVADSLRDGPLPRDAFHQALRDRLPKAMLPWCEGCGSHHVHSSLWRATGIRGVLAVVGREGSSAVFGLPPTTDPLEDPGAALARRFLGVHGPATPAAFAGWAGIAEAHATLLWERAGALAEIESRAWLLAADADAYRAVRKPSGVRLLANLDPLHAPHTRDLIVPDVQTRKRVWTSYGGPGVILADGVFAGTWRRRQNVVTVDTRLALDRIEPEAARLGGAQVRRA